jgi:hypothetical protein
MIASGRAFCPRTSGPVPPPVDLGDDLSDLADRGVGGDSHALGEVDEALGVRGGRAIRAVPAPLGTSGS